MVEVVFNDSTKGGMAMAQKKHREIGAPVGIGFNLDVGDISGAVDGDERKAVFVRLFSSVEFKPSDLAHFFGIQRHDVDDLMNAARKGEAIRVWKSDAAYSACGFAYVCDLIRDIDCPFSAVHLPKHVPVDENTIQAFSSWAEVPDDQFVAFLPLEKPIPRMEKWVHADIWRNLACENAPLRAVINGTLLSVPEDFYDDILAKELPDGDFVMARLIGNILGRYPLGVSDGWYANRIEKMVEDGTLTVVSDMDRSHPYGRVLRKQNASQKEGK